MFGDSKKTIIKILALYLGTSAIFLCFGFYFLNIKMTQNIFYSQMVSLRDISSNILDILRRTYVFEFALVEIERQTPLPFAIYDRQDRLLFSNLERNPTPHELKEGFYRMGNKIFVNPFVMPRREDFREHRKAHYKIFLQDSSVEQKVMFMRLKLAGILGIVFVAMGIVAFILVKLFLKPLNEYISALDAFIKDSTHEINTPLSVILMSIETLDKNHLRPNDIKKLERIKLASLQLNNIHNALVAYNFPQNSKKEKLDLEAILKERLEFFAPFFNQKKLTLKCNLKSAEILAEREKIITLFDNLLSNAVKYNKKGGFIALELKNGEFSIENSGEVIASQNKERIFSRYTRFGSATGGFGIGLNLVKKICDENHIEITLDSSNESNKFTLRW